MTTNHKRLMDARVRIADGERMAREVLQDMLLPYGADGREVCSNEECRGDDFEPMTEMTPGDWQYIERVRVNPKGGFLEMQVMGEWYGLEHTDLHLLLDVVERMFFDL